MRQIRSSVSLLVLFGGGLSSLTGCASGGAGAGLLFNLVLGVGSAVGAYYLTKALTD